MNRLAVSLAPSTTEASLVTLKRLGPLIGLAEVRLDAMDSFDLAKLVGESPVPLIATCRPQREGGSYAGTEADRLSILRQAAQSGFAYVDVEWDALEQLAAGWPTGQTRLIASRHWTTEMPSDLWPFYADLRDRADVVKLVGLARGVPDIVPVVNVWGRATSPVIVLAMGDAGRLTRLLAPCARHSLLSYAAADDAAATAPGQLSLQEMVDTYRLHQIGPDAPVWVHVCSTGDAVARSLALNDGISLHVCLEACDEAPHVLAALRLALPQAQVVTEVDVQDQAAGRP